MSNNDPIPNNNGSILTISQIIKVVVSSAAEAEIGTLFINCQEAIPAQNTLEYLGHKQQTITHTNANRQHHDTWSGKQQHHKKLKLMDMKYHWL